MYKAAQLQSAFVKKNKMKSRGLGDSIEKFTKATGIKTVVKKVSRAETL